jgi:hypothetical protein
MIYSFSGLTKTKCGFRGSPMIGNSFDPEKVRLFSEVHVLFLVICCGENNFC